MVVAPTGVAAINCGGQTIHSFFQLAPGPQPKPQEIRGMNGLVVKKMEVLIIDEVSMVRADLMDSIAASVRINTKNALESDVRALADENWWCGEFRPDSGPR